MKVFSTPGFILILSAFFITACCNLEAESGAVTQSTVKGAQVGFYLVSNSQSNDSGLKVVSFMGQSLQLDLPAIIGNEDIASIKPHSPTSLHLELNFAGGDKLFAATSQHIGHQMLIMIDEEVVNVATIRMGLGKSMIITGLNDKQISKLLNSFAD